MLTLHAPTIADLKRALEDVPDGCSWMGGTNGSIYVSDSLLDSAHTEIDPFDADEFDD